eukprot:TRINITY_DN2602_c2_g1_i1.p3 TRINITY_DN2602_c2_g1~~TRINITY_DN2602_c2_g1_i1.p3  ORF type:complete len:363 (+),score=49.37 TRINITY_DN2602_c2_g1_i1:363-1451(+)
MGDMTEVGILDGGLRWPSFDSFKGLGISASSIASCLEVAKSGVFGRQNQGWIVEKGEQVSQRSCFIESSATGRSSASLSSSICLGSTAVSVDTIVPVRRQSPRCSFDATSSNTYAASNDSEGGNNPGKLKIYDDDNIIFINGEGSNPIIVPRLDLEGLGKKEVATIVPRRGVLKDNDKVYQHIMNQEKVNSPVRLDLSLLLKQKEHSSDNEEPMTPRIFYDQGSARQLHESSKSFVSQSQEDDSTIDDDDERDRLMSGRWSVAVLMSQRPLPRNYDKGQHKQLEQFQKVVELGRKPEGVLASAAVFKLVFERRSFSQRRGGNYEQLWWVLLVIWHVCVLRFRSWGEMTTNGSVNCETRAAEQ